jgi:hypothetical protein
VFLIVYTKPGALTSCAATLLGSYQRHDDFGSRTCLSTIQNAPATGFPQRKRSWFNDIQVSVGPSDYNVSAEDRNEAAFLKCLFAQFFSDLTVCPAVAVHPSLSVDNVCIAYLFRASARHCLVLACRPSGKESVVTRPHMLTRFQA